MPYSSADATTPAGPNAPALRWTDPGLALFALASLQAVFTLPYVILAPGERTNLFTTLLVCLPALWMAFRHGRAGFGWGGLGLWALLGLGLGASALASPTPLAAALRVLSFFCPAVAGLYCARVLFRRPQAVVLLLHLLTLAFAAFVAAHLAFGAHPSFLGLHHHALAGTLLLLSPGPIHLAYTGTRPWRALALLLLALGYLVCFLAGSRVVVLLPFVLIPALLLLRRTPWRHALAGLLISALAALTFFSLYPDKVMRLMHYESTFYRVEGPPAAWEIIKQRPLWGIGLRTPRRAYLQDFEPPFGTTSRKDFLAVVDANVSWDNQWLTMLCGVGVPVTLLYLGLLGCLLAACLGRVRRRELFPGLERGLLFALLATLVHLFVYDGLLYPQINWFFHVLLGVGVFAAPQAAAPLADDPNAS